MLFIIWCALSFSHLPQPGDGLFVARNVFEMLLLELGNTIVHHPLVKVFTTQVRIAGGCFNFKHTVVNLNIWFFENLFTEVREWSSTITVNKVTSNVPVLKRDINIIYFTKPSISNDKSKMLFKWSVVVERASSQVEHQDVFFLRLVAVQTIGDRCCCWLIEDSFDVQTLVNNELSTVKLMQI